MISIHWSSAYSCELWRLIRRDVPERHYRSRRLCPEAIPSPLPLRPERPRPLRWWQQPAENKRSRPGPHGRYSCSYYCRFSPCFGWQDLPPTSLYTQLIRVPMYWKIGRGRSPQERDTVKWLTGHGGSFETTTIFYTAMP